MVARQQEARLLPVRRERRSPTTSSSSTRRKVQDRLDVEPYPKAGAPNPVVDLFVYDLDAKKTTRVDVRDGKPFEDDVVGHYVYHVAWSPDGKELLFHRTNRRQNILEFAAADPETGKCRVVVREEWPASWVENNPDDASSSRTASGSSGPPSGTAGRTSTSTTSSGKLLATRHRPRVRRRPDRPGRRGGRASLYYMAHDGDNPMKLQLHRVGSTARATAG